MEGPPRYAERLEQLLTDKPLAPALGEKGLRLVSDRSDCDGYIRDLEAMFVQVAAERRVAKN